MSAGKMRGQRGSGERDTPGKILFRDNARFAEVFNHTLLREHPVAAEDLEERDTTETAVLELSSGERIPLQLTRDASRFAKKPGRVLSILSIENQDRIDYQMPLRILEEDMVSYARQAREIVLRNRKRWKPDKKQGEGEKGDGTERSAHDGEREKPPYTRDEFISGFRREDRIIPNVTLVVYFGETPWDGPRSLRDMFVESPFQTIAPDYAIYVLDVRRLSDQEIKSYPDDLRVLFLTLKYARDKEQLRHFMETEQAFQNVPEDIWDALTPYIGKRSARLLQPEFRNEEGGIVMDKWFEKLFQDVKQEGRAEGRAEGKAEGIRAVVDVYKNELHLDNDTILSKIISRFEISRDYAVTLL